MSKLESLEALWARYASKWRRLLSAQAIVELELRARFDLDLLAPERIAQRIPPGTVPDCERCEDICCAGVENVVSLRLVDIARLMDIERTDLISKKKPRFTRQDARKRPGLGELSSSELWRILPVMRQVGERRICAALTAELRCSIHPHWPSSCERFPYTLSRVRREVVWGTRCPEKRQDPEQVARGDAMHRAAVATYNERIRDAVLIAHARPSLDALGIGAFLSAPDEDPFEDGRVQGGARLPIVD